MSGSIVTRGSSRGSYGLLEPPRPCARVVTAVLGQALVVERLHVALVPAVRLVVAEQHLLLRRGEVVPRLRRDLVGGGQVVLLLLRAVHVRPIPRGLDGLVAGALAGAGADAAAPHLLVTAAAARDLLLHGVQVGGLWLLAGGGAAAGGVLAHRGGVQVAHALRGGAEHLLVLGPVGGTAQVAEHLEVVLGVLLLKLLLLGSELLLLEG